VHGAAVLLPIGSGVVFTNPAIALGALLVIELVVFVVLPRIACVRRVLDDEQLERRREECVARRRALIAELSEPHQRDFLEVEASSSRLRSSIVLRDGDDDLLGLDALAALYVQLALAHRRAKEALRRTGPVLPEDEITRVEASRAGEDGQPHGPEQRRLHLLRLRVAARRSAAAELVALENDLAVIVDTVRWMEECCATLGSDALHAAVAEQLRFAPLSVELLRDLGSLRDTFDAGALALGRAESEVPAPAAWRRCLRVQLPAPPQAEIGALWSEPVPDADRCQLRNGRSP